ncbi:sorbosone dehydrogenase family protein [Methylosoma difficile]
MFVIYRVFIGLLVWLPSQLLAASAAQQAIIQQLHVPPGFEVSIFADQTANARSLALGDDGVVYVGSGREKVYALKDANHDGIAEQTYVIADKLNMPNGVAYRDGSLYVATIDRILRYPNISQHLDNPPQAVVVYDQLPKDLHHGWKYLRFGPDGKLYTAVGAPCNICLPKAEIYASLVRMNADGSDFEVIAHGIRNTVGFDWQPQSHVLFFNDNGRDYLGDDLPPEELNQWSNKGEHFGYPFCHGGTIADPQFGNQKPCSAFKAPAWRYKAHIAPLGLRFYLGKQFPPEYQQQLFVAQHGSWNRSKPQGYQVAMVKFVGGMPVAEHSFISGWLSQDGTVLGRPVDLLTLPDGSLLMSDDMNGLIYRVAYTGKK